MPAIIPDSIHLTHINTSSTQFDEIKKALNKIVISIEKNSISASSIKIPPVLLHYLDSSHEDYGICIYSEGFIRTENNQTKEYIKGYERYYYTLGIINKIPLKSSSAMCFLIIDRKKMRLRFYRSSVWEKRDPTEFIVIKSQLHHLIMPYFLKN